MDAENNRYKVLIVGPSWVGDMVMAQTLFKLLADQHPQLQLDVLAPAWAAPVLERMPQVRRSVDMPVGHGKLQLGARRQLGHQLRAEAYHQAIVLPNSLKSALVPWFAGIGLRTGWRGEMRFGLLNDIRRLDTERFPLMVERFAALAYPQGAGLPQPLPWPALGVDAANQQRLLASLGLDGERPLLGICPGAEFGPAKQWPAVHYGALAETYIRRGWQVVALGSANDKASVTAIAEHLDPALRSQFCDASGATSLVDAVDLLALCKGAVSNDSGLMHIAAAVGCPLVAVYGSTSPGFTPPLAHQVAVASIDLSCRPCFERECPLGHLNCLVQLEPVQVVSRLDGLLAGAGAG